MANKTGYPMTELFDYMPGNHGLTEETIYEQQPSSSVERVPIFSGSSDNETPMAWIRTNGKNNEEKPLVYFEGPCLILTKDGSAGLLTYKKESDVFTINHHACVLRVKEAWQGKLDPEWFAAQYQGLFFGLVTSKSDNRIFSTEWLDRIRVEVPDFEAVQIPQRDKKRVLAALRNGTTQARNQAVVLLSHHLDEEGYIPTFVGNIADIFNVHGGNSGLTEELIYHNQPLTLSDSIVVLSGATQSANKMGRIARDTVLPSGKKLRTMSQEGILLTRNGFYAGTMTYVSGIEFATNDHAYVLTPKPNWAKRINLQWFTFQYAAPVRGCVSSRSDNATFNKGWLAKLPIRIPNKSVQDALVRKIVALRQVVQKLDGLDAELARLLQLPIQAKTM